MKNTITRFQKGYYRPVSLPIWKWIIIYVIWIIAVLGYILSVYFNPLLLIIGISFQILGMKLTHVWDTGNWKETKKGQDYLNKYGK